MKKCLKKIYRKILMILPTKIALIIDFFRGYKKIINFRNPKYFGEKIQCLKVNTNLIKYTNLVDKYKVRKYIEDKIGKNYLIPLLGVYDNADQINFCELPNKFVIKANHGSGYNLVVKDKNKIDEKKVKKECTKWLKEDFSKIKKEQQYKNIERKLICEKYISDKEDNLIDYKFFCFDGKVEFMKLDFDRYNGHKCNYYDANGVKLNLREGNYPNYEGNFAFPKNYEKMIEIAEILSKDFQFVRVDLYNVDGIIYFGELTFTPAAGANPFHPLKMDIEYAKKIKINKCKKVLYVGSMGIKSGRLDGVTIKSRALLHYIENLDVRLKYIDVDNYKKRFFSIIMSLIMDYNWCDKIVICSSSPGASKLLRFLNKINTKKEIYYFVAGGVFADKLEQGIYKKKNYLNLKKIYVESDEMLLKLTKLGLNNVEKVINFREPVDFQNNYKKEKQTRFVYWGRVIPEKGIEDAIEVIEKLVSTGYSVSLDIIGQASNDYKKKIKEKCNNYIKYLEPIIPNGVIEYETLSKYDILLFPTHFYYEGLPGTIIDSYIAGLAIIGYNWIYAKEYIANGKNGFVCKFEDKKDLFMKCKKIIDSNLIDDFRRYSQKHASIFYSNYVLSDFGKLLIK